MKHATQLEQLVQMLPPRQQTLDFGSTCLWQLLPTADRQTCRDAIAALLVHTIVSTSAENSATHKDEEYE
jgi:hypothetical protein